MIYNTVSNSTCLRRKELVSQVAENTELLYKKNPLPGGQITLRTSQFARYPALNETL